MHVFSQVPPKKLVLRKFTAAAALPTESARTCTHPEGPQRCHLKVAASR